MCFRSANVSIFACAVGSGGGGGGAGEWMRRGQVLANKCTINSSSFIYHITWQLAKPIHKKYYTYMISVRKNCVSQSVLS